MIQQVIRKRAQLAREKDTLDIADTSSLLLNPTQFTITNPASPSSAAVPPSNRKTRHGRHTNKLADFDDNLPPNTNSHKRKRKALAEPADADNSPAPPHARSQEPTTLDGTYNTAQENPRPPVYTTVDKLFTAKDLLSISKAAWESTAQQVVKRLKPNPQQNGAASPNPNADGTNNNSPPTSPTSSPEPAASQNNLSTLTAPAMTRTASLQSQFQQPSTNALNNNLQQAIHVTRSTRGLQNFTGAHLSLQEVRANARNVAAGQIAAQMKLSRFKESDSLALGLSAVEVEDDLARMGIVMGDEGEG